MPVAELQHVLSQSSVWEVATLPAPEARGMFVRARSLGLEPVIVYLPESPPVEDEEQEDS
jgi:hypothetical protein